MRGTHTESNDGPQLTWKCNVFGRTTHRGRGGIAMACTVMKDAWGRGSRSARLAKNEENKQVATYHVRILLKCDHRLLL